MSNSVIIPKELMTAFERWELASFDPQTENNQPDTPTEIQQLITLPTVAELENTRQQAHNEGYAQGHEAGYAIGIQQVRNEAAQMHALLQNMQGALNQLDEQVAQSLLDLALEIARQMVRESLQVKPEAILKIVSDAIGGLPHFNHNAHLILHPEDATLVHEHMGEQLSHAGWKIFTDAKITRGGCRVETAHSQIDATVEARWKCIVESIGQNKSWLL